MDDLTLASGAALLLRLGAGLVFMAHGLPKLLPSSQGAKVGRERLAESIAQLGFPRPEAWALAVAVLQSFGGLLLVLGLLTPWVAGTLAVVMVVAVYKQSQQGFVLGADFPFALLCVLLALVMLGDGRLSLTALFGR